MAATKEGIVLRDSSGKVISDEELAQATGTFRYEVVGEEQRTPRAQALHEQGRQAGSVGDLDKALALFAQAAEAAPAWPYPRYDAAYTWVLKGDFDKAIAAYEEVVKLAPRGFFTALAELDCLKREKAGEWPAGTHKLYAALEWVRDEGQKRKGLEAIVRRAPTFAPAWKDLAGLLDDDRAALSAVEHGLASKPDADTRAHLLLHQAIVLERSGQHESALRLLASVLTDPKTPYGPEQLARLIFRNYSRPH